MSLYAKTQMNDVAYIDTNTGMLKPEYANPSDDFICPSCDCIMHFVSSSSNGRVAHFSGHHNDGCDIALTNGTDNIRNTNFPCDNIESFMNKIEADGLKKPSAGKFKKYPLKKPSSTPNTTPKSKDINTVRDLFNVLANSNPNDIFYDNIKVNDIYCGMNTRYLYTKFINGNHLVYCEYNWHSSDGMTLYFRYPSINSTQIKIYAHLTDKSLSDYFIKMLGSKGTKALILADFNNNNCTITSEVFIIALH